MIGKTKPNSDRDMKVLFLIFHGFAPWNGISKKIGYQCDALRRCGADVRLCYTDFGPDGSQRRMIDGQVLENFGTGLRAKIRKRTAYRKVAQYVLREGVEMVYIRSAHNANPFLNRLLRRLHRHGVRLAMEIPTYPYEGQFRDSPLKDKLRLALDRICRRKTARYLDRIVTFTDLPRIFGVPTVCISNGIDFGRIPVKSGRNAAEDVFRLTGVAELHYWHGYDRVIRGLAEYCREPQPTEVIFNIVGEGAEAERTRLRELTARLGLEGRVIFHGNRAGAELDEIFERTDMGIASLGRHRSGNTKIKTLKNREYAARGIPFVYSETDDDFDGMPYVLKAPANDDPVDIAGLLRFWRSLEMSPGQIRATVEPALSWDVQMRKVLTEIFPEKPEPGCSPERG